MDFTGCVSVSVFSALVAIPIILGITSSALGMKICAIAKSIIKKEKKKHDKIVLLGKDKLNTI